MSANNLAPMASFVFGLGALVSLAVMIWLYSRKRSHAKIQNAFIVFLSFVLAYLLVSFWGQTLLPMLFIAQASYGFVSVGLIGLAIAVGIIWGLYWLLRTAFDAVRYAVGSEPPAEPEPPQGA